MPVCHRVQRIGGRWILRASDFLRIEPNQLSGKWVEPPAKYLQKANGNGETSLIDGYNRLGSVENGRNARTTWDIGFEPSGDEHYASYPTKLVERMMLAGTDENDIVYDPFGGTATTALTAHRLGRQWICSELQPNYVDISNQRLAPHLAQAGLF